MLGYSSAGVEISSSGVEILHMLGTSGCTPDELVAYAEYIRSTPDEIAAYAKHIASTFVTYAERGRGTELMNSCTSTRVLRGMDQNYLGHMYVE